jgi:hypothetical protein
MSETSCGNGHGSGTKLLYNKINAMQSAKQELRLHEMATDVERLCYSIKSMQGNLPNNKLIEIVVTPPVAHGAPHVAMHGAPHAASHAAPNVALHVARHIAPHVSPHVSPHDAPHVVIWLRLRGLCYGHNRPLEMVTPCL